MTNQCTCVVLQLAGSVGVPAVFLVLLLSTPLCLAYGGTWWWWWWWQWLWWWCGCVLSSLDDRPTFVWLLFWWTVVFARFVELRLYARRLQKYMVSCVAQDELNATWSCAHVHIRFLRHPYQQRQQQQQQQQQQKQTFCTCSKTVRAHALHCQSTTQQWDCIAAALLQCICHPHRYIYIYPDGYHWFGGTITTIDWVYLYKVYWGTLDLVSGVSFWFCVYFGILCILESCATLQYPPWLRACIDRYVWTTAHWCVAVDAAATHHADWNCLVVDWPEHWKGY